MATLNGAEFKIIEAEWSTYQNNVIQEILGSDTVEVQNQGHGSEPVRIQGMVHNEKEMDDFQEQFYSNGVLTFIKDPGSDRQYQVYALGNVRRENITNSLLDQGIIFTCMMQLRYPYSESVDTITRSKSITTQNQEWSADDDSIDIKTDGNVDAVPDIQITGGSDNIEITQEDTDSNYNMNNSLSGVTITQAVSTNYYVWSSWGQTINCRKAGMAVIDSIQLWLYQGIAGGSSTVTCSVYDSINGTLLGSKAITVSDQTPQYRTFSFATPIVVVQDEEGCTDAVDGDKIYFKITWTGDNVTFGCDNAGGYADGDLYDFSGSSTGDDARFILTGHSCKEIKQTFEVNNTLKISKVTLNLCKYQYAGSNAVTVKIKDGATVLGTGTAVLSGSTFVEVDFILEEETAHSLELSPGTTYTISIIPPSDSGNSTGVLIKTDTTAGYAEGAVTLVENGGTERVPSHDLLFKLYFIGSNLSIEVYNTTDTTVKCAVADLILEGAIHCINVDGTGTIDYDDDFSTDKYLTDNEGMSGITHDTVNDELDIADDGYLYWLIDTKYPINGIPILTSRINITSGTPTIQISTNGTTWYDIDTAIVDDAETVYPLDSDGNLSLAGKTIFYFRYDCVKAAPATCSIKSFELDVTIHTIYAKNPKITKGSSPSTFRIDQDSDSGIACTVDLIFKNRWWV